jgi:hypothetical protein
MPDLGARSRRAAGSGAAKLVVTVALACAVPVAAVWASAPRPSPTPTPIKAPTRSPTLQKLLVLLMTHPTEKHDADPNRIDFILRTNDFRAPANSGVPVDPKNPSTYVVQRASLALVDRPPFALYPEQIGPEDTLIVQVFLVSSGHMQWHTEDKGAKGPAPGGTAERIPFFGRDPRALYREYLDLILASLQGQPTRPR